MRPPHLCPREDRPMRNAHSRFGLTLSDLVVALAVLLLFGAAIVPAAISRWREQSNRVKCASNLRQIGQGMMMYSNNETRTNGSFPRTYFDPAKTDVSVAVSRQPDSFVKEGPGPVGANNVLASFFLVLKTQDMSAA